MKVRLLTCARGMAAAFSLLILFGLTGSLLAGELKLNRYFSDQMVLQRGKPLAIKGTAEKSAAVTVSFAGQKKEGKADDKGAWIVTLDPVKANSKGETLSVTSNGKTASVEDVVIGDVYLFARQRTIDLSLGRDPVGKKAAAGQRANPNLRTILITTKPTENPLNDLPAEATNGWAAINNETALSMTASAYYFAVDLAAAEKEVPVGIIDLDMGGAFPVGWLSREALEETEKLYGKSDVPGILKHFDGLIGEKKAKKSEEKDAKQNPSEKVKKEGKGKKKKKKGVRPRNPLTYALCPASSWNAVISPLSGTALKAALIQLGNDYPYMIYADMEEKGTQFDRDELNRAYILTYSLRKNGFRMEPVTTPRIPREWRDAFGDESLPVGLITPPGSNLKTLGEHHREMRELQRLTAEKLPGVDVILPGTEHLVYSSQPKDEKLLASRCAQWVKGAVLKEKATVPTGPVFQKLEANFNEATIYFKEGTAEGLSTKSRSVEGFEAAGVEGEYIPVTASIEGTTVRIESDTISRIVRVRYNWSNKPSQSLVNAAGLPAFPFRTEKAPYHWFVRNEEENLPEEYSTPANQWKENDVTLINGQLKTIGYDNFTGWVGPLGVKTGPFGPNMGVREVKKGSPAEGKIFVGDVIYSANGKMLGDKAWLVMAGAITKGETRKGEGRIVLGLRRDGRNINVELTIPVMGSYSPTAPYDCPKTEKIISNLEKWVIDNGAKPGFLNTDALFMLATGDPKLLGYVRRIIYNDIMAKRDPEAEIDPIKAGKSWYNSAEAILLGEYYLATGDRNVLPWLKHVCNRLAATQNKEYGGWRHNFPGGDGYGLIPNAGLPGVMGMHFAKTAGVDINLEEYERAVHHYQEGKAETGILFYGYGKCQRPVPNPIDPKDLEEGQLGTYNGGISAAGILMRFRENWRAAHLCSFISSFAWNHTFDGHGGNFWNNFWTPLGAHEHSRPAFINFWKHHRWYREMNRMFDGSLIQDQQSRSAAGCGVALVAPRERIQITGAPASPFAQEAPETIKAALAAYKKKDYASCVTEVDKVIASGTLAKDKLPTVQYLARQARDIQKSIELDLARMKRLAEEGHVDEAMSFLPGLKGILPEGDERIAKIEKVISSANPKPKVDKAVKKDNKPAETEEKSRWANLVMQEPETKRTSSDKAMDIASKPETASLWKIKVVEDLSEAPKDWTGPQFNDSSWKETTLPISWRMYHTALLRTTFTVKDHRDIDGLRFRAWLFRQQGIEIYLNGTLIGKVNNLEKKTGNLSAEFKDSALSHLRDGSNTLAITSRHNWRWGMLFMRVYNDGFDFNLDAHLKEK